MRILEIQEIKTVPYVPISHPFIERLIGTCRREFLDKILFWNKRDLLNKLNSFQQYYNDNRAHMGITQQIPNQCNTDSTNIVIDIKNYRWKKHCKNLFKLPQAA